MPCDVASFILAEMSDVTWILAAIDQGDWAFARAWLYDRIRDEKNENS